MDRLTAIVPVYGLRRNQSNLIDLVDSIPHEIQLLLVHDLCDQEVWSDVFPTWTNRNVTVFEVAGGNPGVVRNYAIRHANGQWLTFWDSDDLPKPNEILTSLESLEDGEFELLVGSYISRSSEGIRLKTFDSKSLPSRDFRRFLRDFGIWRCVFLTDAVKELTFGTCRIGEDLAYLIEALPSDLSRIAFSSNTFYEYHDDSFMSITNSHLTELDFRNSVSLIRERKFKGEPGRRMKKAAEISLCLSQCKRFPSMTNIMSVLLVTLRYPLLSMVKVFRFPHV